MTFFRDSITVIVGLSKNAGKTSFLNRLLEFSPHPAGVLTTGRDGEDTDLITGEKKPKVLLPAGTFFTSLGYEAKKQSPFVEVRQKLPVTAMGKPLWLLRALHSLEAEVIGPASAEAQANIAELILRQGAKQVFIDGSLERKSIAVTIPHANLVLVAGAFAGSMTVITHELERLMLLASLFPSPTPLFGQIAVKINKIWQMTNFRHYYGHEQEIATLVSENKAEEVYFPGALTVKSLSKMLALDCNTLVCRHPLNLQMKKNDLQSLLSHKKVLCAQQFKIDLLAVNAYDPLGNHQDCEQMLNTISNLCAPLPVADIRQLPLLPFLSK